MRIFVWAIRLVLFFLLFGFAVKNDQLATLNFFFGISWEVPMVFIIMGVFAAGALLGVSASAISLLMTRREAGRLRRQAVRSERELGELRAHSVTSKAV